MQAYEKAENDGYIWCNGICGRTDKSNPSVASNHYDQFVVLVRDQSHLGNTAFGYWAGLGTIGHPRTWALYMGASLLEFGVFFFCFFLFEI